MHNIYKDKNGNQWMESSKDSIIPAIIGAIIAFCIVACILI